MGTVESWSERIAGLSLPTVLMLIVGLTLLRALFRAVRFRFFQFLADLLEPFILALGLVFLVVRPFLFQPFFIPSGSMHPILLEDDRILVNKWVYRFREPRFGDILVFRALPEVAPDEREFIKRVIGLPGDTIEVKEGLILLESPEGILPPERLTLYHSEIRHYLNQREGKNDDEAPLRLATDGIWFKNAYLSPDEFATLSGHPGWRVTMQPGQVLRNGSVLAEPYVAEDPRYRFGPQTVPTGSYFVLGDNRNYSDDSHEWGFLPADRVMGRADAIFWPPARMGSIALP